MNKRLEEKLAMLAFGDLSPEETTRLEQEVAGDREASLILADYRGMRSGLKAMADVPEHQLSTERLRHAVLNRGLRPKARPQFGWLWMPASALALAFAIVMMRQTGSGLPGVGQGPLVRGDANTSSLALNDFKPHISEPFAFASASGQILSVEHHDSSLTLASNSGNARRHRVDRSRLDDVMERVRRGFENQHWVDINPPSLPNGEATLSASAQPSGAPIVLIDSTKDSKTGAHKATEVDSASNVVVGG
jgi:hypothetical protein